MSFILFRGLLKCEQEISSSFRSSLGEIYVGNCHIALMVSPQVLGFYRIVYETIKIHFLGV